MGIIDGLCLNWNAVQLLKTEVWFVTMLVDQRGFVRKNLHQNTRPRTVLNSTVIEMLQEVN